MSPGRVSILTQLSVEPTFSLTRIELPGGAFTTQLARARVDYGFSPLMFVSALLQYSSADRAFSTQPALSVGVSRRAASCSSSTPTSATRPTTRFATPTTGARSQEPRVRGEDQSAAAVLTAYSIGFFREFREHQCKRHTANARHRLARVASRAALPPPTAALARGPSVPRTDSRGFARIRVLRDSAVPDLSP